MAGKGRIHIIILASVFALAGCSPPIGSIGGRSAGPAAGGLNVVVNPSTFERGKKFLPEYLTVSVASSGAAVSLGDCTVYIEDPGYKRVTADGYDLETNGTKSIWVEHKYNNLTGRCAINVREPAGSNNGNGGNGNGGGNNNCSDNGNDNRDNNGGIDGYTWVDL